MKTLGDEEAEKQEALKAKKRQAIKKTKKGEDVEIPELEKEPLTESEEVVEVADTMPAQKAESSDEPKEGTKEEAEAKRLPPQVRRKKVVGKNQKAASGKVEADKKYTLAEAVELLKKISYAKFDETVELHLNVKEKGLRGEVNLPHGTGKSLKIAVADEKLLTEIENGNLDFDVLISTPSFMPKLVPFARVLGPKGLMPNPKNGTVAEDTKAAAEKFKGGTVQYKGEPKAPLVHQAIGKLSFKPEQLVENAEVFLSAVQKKNITSVHMSASMTPSVEIAF